MLAVFLVAIAITDGPHLYQCDAATIKGTVLSVTPAGCLAVPLQDDEAFIRASYLLYLGRVVDAPGLAFWLSWLADRHGDVRAARAEFVGHLCAATDARPAVCPKPASP